MSDQTFAVTEVKWEDNCDELAAIRRTVFILEQGVPEDLEWDGVDIQCRHVLARDSSGRPIGVGRLLPDGHVGRMAVLKPWRGKGVGSTLLESLIAMAQADGHRSVVLNAQTQVTAFYAHFGFEAEGEEFEDA